VPGDGLPKSQSGRWKTEGLKHLTRRVLAFKIAPWPNRCRKSGPPVADTYAAFPLNSWGAERECGTGMRNGNAEWGCKRIWSFAREQSGRTCFD
jgi:hypothetical protein